MARLLTIVLLAAFSCPVVLAQKTNKSNSLDCGLLQWPPKTNPDTVTQFVFSDRVYPVSSCKGVKVTSNFSFTNKTYNVIWLPVNTQNGYIEDFVSKSLHKDGHSYPSHFVIKDTFKCCLFNREYAAIYYTHKMHKGIIIYEQLDGYQMVFLLTIKGISRPYKVLQLLEGLLH